MSGTFPEKLQCTTNRKQTTEGLSTQHQAVLVTFVGFRKPLYSCIEGTCHFSTCPLTFWYVTARDQFYQSFPALVLQATNAEVRRPGYNATQELLALEYSILVHTLLLGLTLECACILFETILNIDIVLKFSSLLISG